MHFRRRQGLKVTIDMSPLVDVVFLLVIFFAVSTTFLETSGLQLDLPTSHSTADRQTEEISVSLGADGELEFEGEIIEPARLPDLLKAAMEQQGSKIVVLRADTTTEHGDVVELMDLIKSAGAEGLTIATRSRSDS